VDKCPWQLAGGLLSHVVKAIRIAILALGPVLLLVCWEAWISYAHNMSAGGQDHNFPVVAMFVALPALELGIMVGLVAAWTKQGRGLLAILAPLAKLSWAFVAGYFVLLVTLGFY
jgi:hypothetical protein